MARSKKTTDALLKEVSAGLERLVETARQEGRDEALADLRQVIGGGAKPRRRKATRASAKPARKAAKKPAKGKKKRKNPWADLTDEQRLARINAIRKGKGLPPRTSL